jgi:hypothetical protein
LTFGQAIEQELLTDYQVVIVGVDEPMVRQWIENYEIVSTNPDSQTDARTLAAKIGMLKAVKDYDLRRVISFHSRVAGAKQFSDELVDVANLIEPANRPEGTFLSDYVSGAMKAGDRKEKIDRLKVLEGYDRGILTNARCLAEGVDVPSLDGVAFIDPRGSQVEIIQAVGRAIRKVRGAKVQKKGTIVLPVFIEDGDDHEASIEASDFKPVWDVLKALRAHDDVLADTLDQYRTNMAKNASQNSESISDKISFDMPVSVDAEFSSALRTVLVEASTASWEFWFGLLEKFNRREGHSRVPQSHKEGKYNLGAWVSEQRRISSGISSERKERLQDLGFIWDTKSADWENGFKKLVQFREIEGHCRVPANYELERFKLGIWVSGQRSRQNRLTSEFKQKLDDLGFVWDIPSETWEEAFRKLLKFKESEGHCRVPPTCSIDNFNLGTWVIYQRSNRGRQNLSPEQKQKLDEIGFIWDPIAVAWKEGYEKLRKYFYENGNSDVKKGYIYKDGFKLGNWVHQQRQSKDSISEYRKKMLDALNFDWDPLQTQWQTTLEDLMIFKKQYGHLRVPATYKTPSGNSLGSFVANIRKNKEKNSKDKIKALDDLGFSWDPREEDWELGLSKLIAFKEREGHCGVPQRHNEGGFNLGSWVSVKRRDKEKLPSEKLSTLNALGLFGSEDD